MIKATLEQWRMLKAVVDHGGFSQAAEAVHKSQSSIHHAVQKLERMLNVDLLEVQGRKAVLTPQGALLLERASYVLDEAEKLETVANSLSRGTETRLRIAVDQSFPPELVYAVLQDVSAVYPFLHIDLLDTVLNGANELLFNGDVDIAISPFPYPQNIGEELCSIRFIAVCSPDHPLGRLDIPLTFEHLKQHRQIVVKDSALHSTADAGWLGSEQRWTVTTVSKSISLIIQGLGFAWLPELSVARHIDAGRIQPLRLRQGGERSTYVHLNYRDIDSLGPAAQLFMDRLRTVSADAKTFD